MFFFFFSSRRRHTRFSRDWSSDVCSSDLPARGPIRPLAHGADNWGEHCLVAAALSTASKRECSRYTDRGIECKSRSGQRPTFFSGGDMDVEALLRPVVEASGLELVDAPFTRENRRRILR